jgi:phosphonate transport system permease protein
MPASPPRYTLPAGVQTALGLLAVALLALVFADIEITTRHPWQELGRMGHGLLAPAWLPWRELLDALAQTLAYALLAVALAGVAGLGLSLLFRWRAVRMTCAALRSVHELFWGLLFMQWLGIHPAAGLLAIALPYTGVFAKVYAELAEEHRHDASPVLPRRADAGSRYAYGLWPRLLPHLWSYSLYRLECGLRSSTVLGFIGLPTLGFHLETAFMQGEYAMAGGILLVFYGLILCIRHWARPRLWLVYLPLAALYLWPDRGADWGLLATLLGDMVPAPVASGDAGASAQWLWEVGRDQMLPGAWNTLLVTQVALAGAGLIALLGFPLIARPFLPAPLRWGGHLLLVVLRSTPELILAFAALLLWGPSMLPAIVALAIHNGAIIAHLSGRYADQLPVLNPAPMRAIDRYGFEVLPRIWGQLLAFLCYRWEIILRESAILGILGIHTLGFYIDSAFEAFRLDVAMALILATALLNIGVDALSRGLRQRLHLNSTPEARTPC